MRLSVAIITLNEEKNLGRTLDSVKWADEIVVVDSGSTDRTREIAEKYGVRSIVEPWRGFAAQKNFAIEQCKGDWVLSLDADEEVTRELQAEIQRILADANTRQDVVGYLMPRKNHFLGRWLRHGGLYPDAKLRLFRKGAARYQPQLVHESMVADGPTIQLSGALNHHAYADIASFVEHLNRYSSLGAEMAVAERPRGFNLLMILLNPKATFIKNY